LTLIDAPTGATLDGSGVFQWNVPTAADGWQQVVILRTGVTGDTTVDRFHLLADSSVPVFTSGSLQAQAVDPNTIQVTAPDAEDISGVLRYRLERDGAIVGIWQTAPLFSDTGLTPNSEHTYRIQAEDSSPGAWTSPWSDGISVRSLAESPNAPILGDAAATTVVLTSLASDANSVGTEYAVYNATSDSFVTADGDISATPVWQIAALWAGLTVDGLRPDTAYEFQVQARNATGIETAKGLAATIYTLPETIPPTVLSISYSQVPNKVTLIFSEPVAISLKDLTVEDASHTAIDLSTATLNYLSDDSEASLAFAVSLAGGGHTLTLKSSSIQDMSGNLLDGDQNGEPGGDYTFLFSVFNLDADCNRTADALTDGILMLRYLFDPAGAWNYSDALGSGATLTSRENIKSFLDNGQTTVLDVDGNGTPDALTDGILILRYLFDPAGDWNYSDALGSGATRTTRTAIKAYLDQYNPGLAATVADSSIDLASAAADPTAESYSFADTPSVSSPDSLSASTTLSSVAVEGVLAASQTNAEESDTASPVLVEIGAPDGPNLLGEEVAQPSAQATAIDVADSAPIVEAALADWSAVGLSAQTVETLTQTSIVSTDLHGTAIGRAIGSTMYLDLDAAGHGWFVDPAPDRDAEFIAPQTGAQQALDPQAVDRMDLLTVVEHELGYIAGLADHSPSDLMSDQLPTGLRRSIRATHLDSVFANEEPFGWL
jgi:hypothetical protein